MKIFFICDVCGKKDENSGVINECEEKHKKECSHNTPPAYKIGGCVDEVISFCQYCNEVFGVVSIPNAIRLYEKAYGSDEFNILLEKLFKCDTLVFQNEVD